MNCTSITNCGSLYDDDVHKLNVPPFEPTCDRSSTHEIMTEVYGACAWQ